MRILLFGAHGQVGWELARSLQPLGQVVVPPRASYDFADVATIARLVSAAEPDVIVNAAAYTAVDQAEKEADSAFTANATAPEALASSARACGALFVHYSTDYVFDGTSHRPYREDDAVNPLQVYGRSKLAGEEAIRASASDHLILRTSWVYGARGKNFLRTILRLAGEREELRIVGDQTGAPTAARWIADATASIVSKTQEERRRSVFRSDTLNLTAAGETSWHGFAQAIVRGAKQRGAELKCERVVPITTADYPTPATRPPYSVLGGERVTERYGLHRPDWQSSLELCLDDLLSA